MSDVLISDLPLFAPASADRVVTLQHGSGTVGVSTVASLRDGFVYTQSAPSALWIINHNLGYRPSVELRTPGGAVFAADILHISANQVQVLLVTVMAGTAHLH